MTHIEEIPEALRPVVEDVLQAIVSSTSVDLLSEQKLAELRTICTCSPWIASELANQPMMLKKLLLDDLSICLSLEDYEKRLSAELGVPVISEEKSPQHKVEHELEIGSEKQTAGWDMDEDDFMSVMRVNRQFEMIRIAWRDLCGIATTLETLNSLSDFADACIKSSVLFAEQALHPRFGFPMDSVNERQQLIVLCMGKLGGRELNFSSDIDLILCYPHAGETNGRKCVSNEEYFRKLAQHFFRLLNKVTADGFVFRVDLRLRPFGDSGPLVINFEGVEHYYLTQGREWERYAMIKARPICGDRERREQLMELLRPFVYRRYLDYSVFESLRELKQKIAAQVEKKGGPANIKTGFGGIREIEFIGQAFQLLRGGRDKSLQCREILEVLRFVSIQQLLPSMDVEHLNSAYDFLRKSENRLQMMRDQQVHVIPVDALDLERLSFAMGYQTTALFLTELDHHRSIVNGIFTELFSMEESNVDNDKTDADRGRSVNSHEDGLDFWIQFWSSLPDDIALHEFEAARSANSTGDSDSDIADGSGNSPGNHIGSGLDSDLQKQYIDALISEGFNDPGTVLGKLCELKSGSFRRNLTTVAQQRLDAVLPRLLMNSKENSPADEMVGRMLSLMRAIAGRSVYLQVLIERPAALQMLCSLFASSSWLTEFVTQHPIVIDELLSGRTIGEPPQRQDLDSDMSYTLDRLAGEDLEVRMDTLRQFKLANTMRIAVAELNGELDLAGVSSRLSWIAELTLQAVCDLVWSEMTERHGVPECVEGGQSFEPAFAIAAYGKLGGLELGYGSDLDIVFLHDSSGEIQQTNGEKSIENMVFFARMAQKVVHFISTLTPAGVLYAIDTRLRPNGRSGLLVSSLKAFELYQRDEAWTWEHQALVRARIVVGTLDVQQAFGDIRRSVLVTPRDPMKLCRDVVDMRVRMANELVSRQEGWFDLKQDRGGIADIEFMVQYMVLAQASKHADLLADTDNIRVLKTARELDLISDSDCDALSTAYLEYRRRVHQLALNEQVATVKLDDVLDKHRSNVLDVWGRVMNLPES